MSEHTMAQDMGEARDYASFGGENAELAEDLRQQIRPESRSPRIDSQTHTDYVSKKTDSLTGEKPNWLTKAQEGLAKIYADQAREEAAATDPNNSSGEGFSGSPLDSPSGIAIRRAETNQSPNSPPVVAPEADDAEQGLEDTPVTPTQPPEASELTPNQGDNQTDTTGTSEPEPPNEATASSPEENPTDDAEGSATSEAEPTDSPKTIEYGGRRVIWSERREKALNNPNFTEEQKQDFVTRFIDHDQSSIARGSVDPETLAELGLDAEGKPLANPDEVAQAEAAATNADGTGVEGDPDAGTGDIPPGTFYDGDTPPGPVNIPPNPENNPDSEPPNPANNPDSEPPGPINDPDSDPTVNRQTDTRRGNPGEFGRIVRRAAVEIWTELRERHLLERAKGAFDNWRNNSRRRSERLRQRYEADGRPDTKWQKWRVEHKEKSEERRAAFWDKWLGTKIGQKEDERSGGREGRRRLIDQPEEGMDRAIRLLANLRNDQERFRGIGLHRNRDKVQQIEASFRSFASQEVANTVSSMIEERQTERAGHMRAADIIRSAMARSEEESHLSGEPLEAYMQEVSQSVASKGEFATLSHIAGKHMDEYFKNPNNRDELAKGIAILDTIKALSDAHDEGLIDDRVILDVNQLTYEGKNPDEIIDGFSQTITPEEVQAATIGSILDIMQKVDQTQAEMKNTYRKNDGKIRQYLSSPRWKKGVGTVIAGAGTIGMFTMGPLGAVVASGGIFMARQSGMRERVENRANKRAGQQSELIGRVIEDPLIQDMYRRLDVTLPTHGSDVVDLPSREHLRADRLSDYNARELAEALASEEIVSNEERLSAITEQIIDSMLTTSSNRARSKLTHRMWSTSFSAFASSLPVVVTSPSIFFGSRVIRSGIALGSVALPLVGAWRTRKTYPAVKPPAR